MLDSSSGLCHTNRPRLGCTTEVHSLRCHWMAPRTEIQGAGISFTCILLTLQKTAALLALLPLSLQADPKCALIVECQGVPQPAHTALWRIDDVKVPK